MTAEGIEAARRLAEHAGVPFASIEPTDGAQVPHRPVDPAVHGLLGPEVCRRLGLLPLAVDDGTVVVAAAEPIQYLPYELAVALGGRPVSFVVVPADQLARALARLAPGQARSGVQELRR